MPRHLARLSHGLCGPCDNWILSTFFYKVGGRLSPPTHKHRGALASSGAGAGRGGRPGAAPTAPWTRGRSLSKSTVEGTCHRALGTNSFIKKKQIFGINYNDYTIRRFQGGHPFSLYPLFLHFLLLLIKLPKGFKISPPPCMGCMGEYGRNLIHPMFLNWRASRFFPFLIMLLSYYDGT